MNENKIKVLVVEDNPGDAFLIEEMLRGLNLDLKVTQLGDGRQAMDALMAKGFISPDLVILDLNLPRVYGLDVLAYMKSIPALSSISVMIMTGYLKGEDEIRARSLGASDYCIKPTSIDEMEIPR